MIHLLKKTSTKISAVVLVVCATVWLATPAWAQAPDAEAEVTGFFEDGIGQLVAIVLAVAGVGLTLFLINIGLRMVQGLLKARGSKVV